MIRGNFNIMKGTKNFSEHNAKNSSENSIAIPRNRKKENNSLTYDVNGRVYCKLKSVKLHC